MVETYRDGIVVGKTFVASCTLSFTVKGDSVSISVVLSDEAYNRFLDYCEQNELTDLDFALAKMFIFSESINALTFVERKEGGEA